MTTDPKPIQQVISKRMTITAECEMECGISLRLVAHIPNGLPRPGTGWPFILGKHFEALEAALQAALDGGQS